MSAPTQRATLALASLGFVSLGLPEGLLGVAWPSIRASFDLPLDALGALLATFASGYFLSSAISGRILGRFGIGWVLAASCTLTGVSLLGYAFAPAWLTMVGLGFVLGLGAGTIDAGLNVYAAVQHGARVLNWMHAAFGVGAAVGPLLMTAVLASGMAWPLGYAIVALAEFGLAVGYAMKRSRFGAPPKATESEADQGALGDMLRMPLAWISLGLFFVYVGLEAGAGQWSYTLFTQSRGVPAVLAGLLVSAYWTSLTLGRVVFGVMVNHVGVDALLRACLAASVAAAALIWWNLPVLSLVALAALGLVLAPVFPSLIAETPARLGSAHTANAVGLQVAAAVVGGAGLPGVVGLLAARLGLEVVGPCLLVAACGLFVLHEALIRRACAPPRSARSRTDAAASTPERA